MHNYDHPARLAGTVLWSIIVVLLLLTCCTSQSSDTSETCLPTDNIAFSAWRGIVSGRTPESEIVALLGEPDNVAPYLADGLSTYHYYPRPDRCGFFSITVQDGIVQSVTEVSASGALSSPIFSSLVEAGCRPTIVTQTISSNPVWAYPELGVAFEVGPDGLALVEQHFTPLSMPTYLASWSGADLRLDPAFNAIHTIEQLGIEPGVTTQAEVERTLQPGARVDTVRVIWVRPRQSPSGLPEQEYEIGPLDRALLPYGTARIRVGEGVVLTAGFNHALTTLPDTSGQYLPETVSPEIQVYTLGDALREYGDPSLAFVTECEGILLELHLVYPREGRQVTVFTDILGISDRYCLTLDSSASVIWHFPRMSEEEFREQLSTLWLEGRSPSCGYQEVDWRGIAQFCEWDHHSGCLQP